MQTVLQQSSPWYAPVHVTRRLQVDLQHALLPRYTHDQITPRCPGLLWLTNDLLRLPLVLATMNIAEQVNHGPPGATEGRTIIGREGGEGSGRRRGSIGPAGFILLNVVNDTSVGRTPLSILD